MYVKAIQAAGHDEAMQSLDGQLFIKPTTLQEVTFYNELATDDYMLAVTSRFMGTLAEHRPQVEASEDSPGQDRELKELIQKAQDQGAVSDTMDQIQRFLEPAPISPTTKHPVTIVLENITYGFEKPSVLDAKLGSRLWDESASAEKRQRLDQVSQSTTSGTLGVRVAGMSLYNPDNGQRTWYDKQFGRSMKTDAAIDGFAEFFLEARNSKGPYSPEIKYALAHHIRDELEYIYEIVSSRELRMISASVLVVYEADPVEFLRRVNEGNARVEAAETEDETAGRTEDESDDSDDDEELPLFRVKLIDFAHSKVTPGEGPDTNTLKGLESLVDIFKALEKRYEAELQALDGSMK